MILDIVLVALILFSMIIGYRNGLARSVIKSLGWLIALIAAYIFTPQAVDFLVAKTELKSTIYNAILAKVASGVNSLFTQLPKILTDVLTKVTGNVSGSKLAESLTDTSLKIIGFLCLVILIRIAMAFILLFFSKKDKQGFVAFVDGVFGGVFGIVSGLILVLVLLAFLMPLNSLVGKDILIGQLNASVLGKILYNTNPILLITKAFF